MDDFTSLAAVRSVLDRARECLAREDLPGLVMNDPGSGQYVAAYERVLSGGVPALLEVHDGVRLLDGFEITENLLLSHTDASRSVCHRWFSVLTGCIEILAYDGLSGPPTPLSQTLCQLLADSFALQVASDRRAPLDLLPLVFEELRRASGSRHLHALALLGELLVASLDDQEVEAKCRQLIKCHDDLQDSWGNDGPKNVWCVERPGFVSRAARKRPSRRSRRPQKKELSMWLELVEAHFPSSPEMARTTAERLLRDGKEWLGT